MVQEAVEERNVNQPEGGLPGEEYGMETPQEIIYNAWKNTPKPILYETSDMKGKQVIKEVRKRNVSRRL